MRIRLPILIGSDKAVIGRRRAAETGADDADMAYRVVAYHIRLLIQASKHKLLLVKYLLAHRRKDGYSRFQETDEVKEKFSDPKSISSIQLGIRT
ncbi:hypothetical protein C5167_031829 [Papaver somniferum]|uniref:Uncharacterized protein n=1 Tax=Papaver somniferum TaxID=3469 RepID=A0A4Y7K841_PAPSO|nr:hypothetical protein C5167_031829 [Papaver somniferum]